MPLLYHPLCEHGKKKTEVLEHEMVPLTNESRDEKNALKVVEEEGPGIYLSTEYYIVLVLFSYIS